MKAKANQAPSRLAPLAAAALTLASAAAAGACGDSSNASDFTGMDDASDERSQADGPPSGDGGGQCFACPVGSLDSGVSSYTDLPPTPLIDDGSGGGGEDAGRDAGGAAAPGSAASLFGAATQGATTGGPCLVEPEVNSLYPKNWLRPRFAWLPTPGENLFELRIHVANQTNDLVVYTTATQWTMPKPMWSALAADSSDVPMTVSIRGGVYDGQHVTKEALGSSGPPGSRRSRRRGPSCTGRSSPRRRRGRSRGSRSETRPSSPSSSRRR